MATTTGMILITIMATAIGDRGVRVRWVTFALATESSRGWGTYKAQHVANKNRLRNCGACLLITDN
jgi:hypothetical protein